MAFLHPSALIFIICLSTTVIHAYASFDITKQKCPKIAPMPNIDLSLLLGDWYLVAASENFLLDFPSSRVACMEATFAEKSSSTLEIAATWSNGNDGTSGNGTTEYKVDPREPGTFERDLTVQATNMLGMSYPKKATRRSTVLWTNYYDLQLTYSCVEVDHFWYTEPCVTFEIGSRERNFDSFSQLYPLLNILRSYDIDLNDLVAVPNNEHQCAKQQQIKRMH